MQLAFLPLSFRKDDGGAAVASGPTQSDVHVDGVMGAIHPFSPGPDPRMCARCGLTRSSHARSFKKQTGFDTPFWEPAPDEPSPPPTPLQYAEQMHNNTSATPPSPLLVRYMTPADVSTATTPPSSPPAFHEPIIKRSPRGMETGDLGEWASTRNPGVFNSPGQKISDKNMRPADQDFPSAAGVPNRQDGPTFGPDNPGLDPITQIAATSRMASPNIPIPREDRKHFFEQCPQCGIAVNGTEMTCPNAWCGHDLENDPTASYDHWKITGGMAK